MHPVAPLTQRDARGPGFSRCCAIAVICCSCVRVRVRPAQFELRPETGLHPHRYYVGCAVLAVHKHMHGLHNRVNPLFAVGHEGTTNREVHFVIRVRAVVFHCVVALASDIESHRSTSRYRLLARHLVILCRAAPCQIGCETSRPCSNFRNSSVHTRVELHPCNVLRLCLFPGAARNDRKDKPENHSIRTPVFHFRLLESNR